MSYFKIMNKILYETDTVLENAEAYVSVNKNLSIEVFQGEINSYDIAESGGLSLRGIYNGKMGYAYTEKIDESSIDILIEGVIDNSKYIDEDETIYSGSNDYEKVDMIDYGLEDIDNTKKIELIKKIEEEVLKYDNIDKTMVSYNEYYNERYILNTKGIELKDSDRRAIISVSVFAKDGDEVQTGAAIKRFRDFDSLDYKEIAREGVEDAINKLGAKSISSNDYPIVFKNTTFSDLLAAFASIFSAESVDKGLSLLKDKIGEEIGSSLLNIVDDPFLENGIGSQSFDSEGTASIFKELVKDGVLQTYISNRKIADKMGKQSTGNASRSYKGSIGISPTNLYIVNGNKTEDELIEGIDNGVYIDSLQGLHSGLDPVSGDFSLSAGGFKIEEGKKTKPVNLITIAGNIFQVFKDIEAIADNLEFGSASGGVIGSPSIYISSLSIAGE